jgi:hypothetical protein
MNNVWLANPEEHDFPAAVDYLELLMPTKDAATIVAQLKKAKTIIKKAKDILRASELPLLPKENKHVVANLKKFKKGKKLSPLLLIRSNGKLVIADGYHRICASYYLSEDLEVPCRLV